MGALVRISRLGAAVVAFGLKRDGSVTVLAALFLCTLFILGVFGIEAANLYVVRLKDQRVADLANLAAAATPAPIVGSAPSPLATATAANVVQVNGLAAATVVTGTQVSPKSPPDLVLSTRVTRNVQRLFPGALVGSSTTVGALSLANVGSGTGLCISSLLGPTNIYGSSRVAGPNCGLAAYTYLYVCGTAAVTLNSVSVGTTAATEAGYLCNSASYTPGAAAFTYQASVTDTLAGKPDIVAIRQRLAAMGNPGWPYGTTSPRSILNPSTGSGIDITVTAGASFSFPGSTADPTCSSPIVVARNVTVTGSGSAQFGSGCYVITGSVSFQNGANLTVTTVSGAATTFVFKGSITNGAGTLSLPDAAYNFVGSISNTAGGTITVGSGAKVFAGSVGNGTGAMRFVDGPHYFNGGSISNGQGTVTFGNGAFYLWGGSLAQNAGGTTTFGTGPFTFYGGTVTNSGTLLFGNGPYRFQGGSLTLSGSASTRFGVGDVDFYGGTILMGGATTVFGYGGSAVTGSSTVSLYGGSMALTSQNLTAVGVTFAFKGGSVSLLGIGTINATAPTGDGPSYGYRNILMVVYGGAFSLYQSTNPSDTLSGLIYVPDSNASLYGNQTATYPAGGCFQLVAGVVDIYQQAKLDFAPCAGVTDVSGSPALVQ